MLQWASCAPSYFIRISENIYCLQDKDRDGLISYEEFCDKKTKTEIAFEVKNWVKGLLNPVLLPKALDINSDGYISKNEMVSASIRSGFYGHKLDFYPNFIIRSGRRLSKVEVDAAFKEYDKNKVRRNSKFSSFFRDLVPEYESPGNTNTRPFKHLCTLELRAERKWLCGFVINSWCSFPPI